MAMVFSSMSVAVGSRGCDAGETQLKSRLLHNFQEMFKVAPAFIANLHERLCMPGKFVVLEVDMDQVPRFSHKANIDMISRMLTEVFVIGSANRPANSMVSRGNFHFTLAMKTKDAADAVLTMAAAKLDSIIVAFGRQDDVYHVIISDDRIFEQATQLLRQGGSPAKNLPRAQATAAVTALSRQMLTNAPRGAAQGRPAITYLSYNSDSESISNESEWECDDCGKIFSNEHALKQHQDAKGHW